MRQEKEYDGMIQVIGKVKANAVIISIKTDGTASWDQTRMLVLDMIFHLSKFYKDLTNQTS
jgi:hypothetical protein